MDKNQPIRSRKLQHRQEDRGEGDAHTEKKIYYNCDNTYIFCYSGGVQVGHEYNYRI